MSNFNMVVLIGNLTRDPEVKQRTGSNCVLRFTLGINKKWRDNNGNLQERASFPQCIAWGSTARFIEQYFRKGQPILVQGELTTHSYDGEDGVRRYVTEVLVKNVNFVGGAKSAQSGASTSGYANSHGESYPGDADTPF